MQETLVILTYENHIFIFHQQFDFLEVLGVDIQFLSEGACDLL